MSVDGAIRAVVDDVDAVLAALRAALADPAVAFDAGAEAAAVAAVAREQLAARSVLFGAGVALAPDRAGRTSITWWQAVGATRTLRPLDAAAPSTTSVRPYEHLEWYRVPADTGEPHMTGPYVDLLCTDEPTLTFTAPLDVDGGFAGVVGVDVVVRAFERAVEPAMRAAGAPLLVITGEGRVVLSTDPAVLVQRRLPEDALSGLRVDPVPGTHLSVASPR